MEKYLIEAWDQQAGQWDYSGVCTLSLEECLCDSEEEAEKLVEGFSGWGSDWASGEYRVRAVEIAAD
jgi:hypothetical protein